MKSCFVIFECCTRALTLHCPPQTSMKCASVERWGKERMMPRCRGFFNLPAPTTRAWLMKKKSTEFPVFGLVVCFRNVNSRFVIVIATGRGKVFGRKNFGSPPKVSIMYTFLGVVDVFAASKWKILISVQMNLSTRFNYICKENQGPWFSVKYSNFGIKCMFSLFVC